MVIVEAQLVLQLYFLSWLSVQTKWDYTQKSTYCSFPVEEKLANWQNSF